MKAVSLAVLALFTGLIVLLLVADIAYLAQWKVGPRRVCEILGSVEVFNALFLSLLTSGLTLVHVLLTAIPVGYALSRCRFRGHTLVDTAVDVPIVLPPVVIGLSLLAFFGTAPGAFAKEALNALCDTLHGGVSALLALFGASAAGGRALDFWQEIIPGVDGIFGIVLCQYLVAVSYCIRAVKAAFDEVDRNLEDVALTLGCSRARAFFCVTLPLARNGVVAGGVMAWARAMGTFGPLMVFVGTGRRVQVLPTTMWLHLNIGNVESALVVALVTMLMAAAAILLVHKLAPGRRWT